MEILIKKKERVNNHSKVVKIFQTILSSESPIDQDKEHFWVMGLNTKKQIMYIELVTLGLLSQTLVHPREVFRLAILKGVAAIILAHNHPSGDIEPSEQDKVMTDRLAEAGQILGIPVLDHIIIAENEQCFSFAAEGLIKNNFFENYKID